MRNDAELVSGTSIKLKQDTDVQTCNDVHRRIYISRACHVRLSGRFARASYDVLFHKETAKLEILENMRSVTACCLAVRCLAS